MELIGMTNCPKISVIIPTRNRSQYLKRMLDKLFEDTYPNREVIVVDGASTDGTVELLKSYGDRITRWVSEPDDGENFAVNRALRMADGEIIKYMPDDDMLRPGALGSAAKYLVEHADVDILFGQTAIWDERGGGRTLSFVTDVADTGRLTLRHWLRETQGVFTPAAFIRKGVFDRIGLLSTDYVPGDMEFWARAVSMGMKMGLMPDVVVDYCVTGYNGWITKRWRVDRDMVRINARYGSVLDILNCVMRKFLYPPLYWVCQRIHFHPLRILRRWRA